jgi:heme-degrading monooxygenase HmoA
VFARIATYYSADPTPYWELEEGERVRLRAREKLRQMDGYEGSFFFLDHQSGKAISITLWESEEAMHRSEEVARTIRKEIAAGLANIVDVEHYEVGNMVVQEIHERELAEHELRVARSIQQASLPKEVPELEGWQISPHYQPAREVGGDFYDFHLLSEGHVGLVVGDATGKGVPAALVMSTARGM